MCDKSDCDCQSLGVFRGPLVSGSHDFDEHCMFGNDMYLTKGQVDFLNEHCNHFPTEEFEYYVYRMTKSAVIKNKCKLDIGKKFTAKYLKRFIDDAPGNDVTLSLEYTDSNARFKVTMKMAKGKAKNAIIATGWSKAMNTYEIKEGAIYIFEFYVDMKGKLALMIHSLPDDCDDSDSSESSE
ncbi:uncharacterized protein [Lolium perenne]|uniref:uncharacterized protein n=1 Tax=Lolium perenne TaxID=4522 RepID=UPI0021EADB0E|nr:uncharacterized protein LOC127315403 [Lolium perenne]